MKKRLILMLVCIGTLAAMFGTLSFILPARQIDKLPTPESLYLSGYTLRWTHVSNAYGYVLSIDGNEVECYDNSYKLSLSDEGKTFRVKAFSKHEAIGDSDYTATLTVDFATDLNDYDVLTYKCNEIGFRHEEFNYKGEGIPIPTLDTEKHGYTFLGWQVYRDGRLTTVESPFIASGDFTLIARVKENSYGVTFYGTDSVPITDDAPVSFSPSTYKSVLNYSPSKDGYHVNAWRIGEDGPVLTDENFPFEELKLYPVVTLLTDGLVFEETHGGYAVTDYVGTDSEVHVPSYYNGSPVVSVECGALILQDKACHSVHFYGSTVVKSGAVMGGAELNCCEFFGSSTAEEGAITFTGIEAVTVRIYGNLLPSDFYRFYLDVEGNGVNVKVAEGKLSQAALLYPEATISAL